MSSAVQNASQSSRKPVALFYPDFAEAFVVDRRELDMVSSIRFSCRVRGKITTRIVSDGTVGFGPVSPVNAWTGYVYGMGPRRFSQF